MIPAVLLALAPLQSTWHVDGAAIIHGNGSPSSPFASIQSGIDAAATTGDTIRVSSGRYSESLVLAGKSVELVAVSGLGSVVVDPNGAGSAMSILSPPPGSTTVVRGFRFENGTGFKATNGVTRGGALYAAAAGDTAFDSCEFIANTADEGGGVYLDGGRHAFTSCRFEFNRGDRGGGLYSAGAELLLQNSSFSDNRTVRSTSSSRFQGVGILVVDGLVAGSSPGRVDIEGCIFDRNASGTPGSTFAHAADGCGMFLDTAAEVTVRDSRIRGNGRGEVPSIGGRGGGIWAGPTVVLTHCHVRDNGARMSAGGGIHGDVVARDCIITGNRAGEGGGAFGGTYIDCLFEGNAGGGICCAEGATGGGAQGATLIGCTLRANRVFEGLALLGAGAHLCDLTRCVVESNFVDLSGFPATPAAAGGGGISNSSAVDTVIRNNTHLLGGGAYESTLERCEIRSNHGFDAGGGVAGSTVAESSIADNTAGLFGGGAVDSALTRCVLHGNRADRCGGAAGGQLDFCTVTGNTAADQIGGVGSNGEFLAPLPGFQTTLRNSIVYANEPLDVGIASGPQSNATTFDATWSLVGDGWAGLGNLAGDGLVAGPAAGQAWLLRTSPAIDAADPSAPLDPDGSRADMGAVPFDRFFVPRPAEYCTAKANSVGCAPQIASTGMASVGGADDFVLVGTGFTAESFAFAALSPQPSTAFIGSGRVCVQGGGLVRLGLGPTGGTAGLCDGGLSVLLDQSSLSAYGAGTLLYAQFFIRDPAHPDGTGLASTAGLEFRVLP